MRSTSEHAAVVRVAGDAPLGPPHVDELSGAPRGEEQRWGFVVVGTWNEQGKRPALAARLFFESSDGDEYIYTEFWPGADAAMDRLLEPVGNYSNPAVRAARLPLGKRIDVVVGEGDDAGLIKGFMWPVDEKGRPVVADAVAG